MVIVIPELRSSASKHRRMLREKENGLRPLPFRLWATSDASCIRISRMITAPAGHRAAGCHSGCNGFEQVPAFKGPSLIVYMKRLQTWKSPSQMARFGANLPQAVDYR
jgi:hypothetical protein